MHTRALLSCVVVAVSTAIGCGDSHEGSTNVAPGDPFMAYNAEGGNVTVLGGAEPTAPSGTAGTTSVAGDVPVGETPVLVGEAAVSDEVCISDTLCEVPETAAEEWCPNDGGPTGPVDLIYVDGVLVETICYPPADDPDRPTEVIASSGDVDVAQNANNTTVVFDPATDGTPIVGNVTVDGNNVAIYGNGPDATIIDGDVALDGNNVRLRGVTITGDLLLNKNNVAIVLCKVLGNIRLESVATNNSIVAENDIFGDFTSDSNNNLFVGNDVSGAWNHTGNNNVCDRNAAFMDADQDEIIDLDERGAALGCDP